MFFADQSDEPFAVNTDADDDAADDADEPAQTPAEPTRTFLFTDVERSGRLWRDSPREMDAALRGHDALLRQTAQTFRGQVFKTMGDGAFLVFEAASDALAAACHAQAAFAREELPLALSVRMALHSGAAQARNGDYFGLTLNQTMRLLGAIHGKQIVLTQTTAHLVENRLPAQIALHSVGVHHLRDFDRPEPLFQVETDLFPCPARPLRTESLAPPHNLPRQIASFVGRETEITQIKRLIFQSPLVTLTGTGGTGKTRLALVIAEALLPDFEHGVFFVDLSPLTAGEQSGDQIAQAVAQAVGIKNEAGQTTRETVISHLRSCSLLLVLDNCEHLIENAAQFADTLLRACANLHVLATSRESLGLWGEAVRPVPPLALPPDGKRLVSLAKLQTFEAVRLLLERAQSQNPAFRLTRSDVPHITRLCRLLDGLPLGLEIAASWAGVLAPAQIAGRLSDRVKLLQAGGERIALPRQKTLRAVLDWSYHLLEKPEQILLRRLSVFAGGWDLEAAEAVCENADSENREDEEIDVLSGLMILVKKSLIVVDYQAGERNNAETRPRYRMLETLKHYAAQKLTETGEGGAAAKRHQAYFAQRAEAIEPNLRGRDQKKWLDAAETDHDNFRAALQGGDASSRLRIAGALGRFWLIRGYFAEGRQALSEVCDNNDGAAVTEDAALYAKALNAAGYLSMSFGDFEAAHTYYRRCLVLQEQTGDALGLAIVLSNLGIIASREKRFEDAAAFYERSAGLFRTQNAEARLANVLGNMGALYLAQKHYADAQTALSEALGLQKKHNELFSVANILSNLGHACLRQGMYEVARRHLCESLTVRRALGDKNNEQALTGLAHIDILQQQWKRAVIFLAAAQQSRENTACVPESGDEDELVQHTAPAKKYWGPEKFDALWHQARAVSLDEVIKTALEAAF